MIDRCPVHDFCCQVITALRQTVLPAFGVMALSGSVLYCSHVNAALPDVDTATVLKSKSVLVSELAQTQYSALSEYSELSDSAVSGSSEAYTADSGNAALGRTVSASSTDTESEVPDSISQVNGTDTTKVSGTVNTYSNKQEQSASGEQSVSEVPVQEQGESQADPSANAFVLICAILVIVMSVPGIALFYGGLVRSKNVLSIMQQCMVVFSVCFLIWLVAGYSLVFSGPVVHVLTANGQDTSLLDYVSLLVGDFSKSFLSGVAPHSVSGSISEFNFVIFQGAFCAISACLIVGATAERIRFSALILGIAFWVIFSYIPLAHMVWGQGLIEQFCAAYDFAGGTVVHINAATAAIVVAKMLGPRTDLNRVALAPHSLPLSYLGCGMLWFGWFGFNAGSELSPDGISTLAFANTVFAPAAGALVWSLGEYRLNGRTSSLGSSSGVLSGLVAITPGCAYVSPLAAIVIGGVSALICLWGVRGFKRKTKVDDSLDVFGIHGLGAIVGALFTGIFCDPDLGGTGFKGFHESIVTQFLGQLGSVVIALIWSAAVSIVAFTLAGKLCHGLRVSHDDERMGLDLSYHGERGYSH